MATFKENLKTTFVNFRKKYIDKDIGYVECSTGRSTAAKVVTMSTFQLKTGSVIRVRFTDTGSSNPSSGNLSLNVNSTGAKTIVDGKSNKTVATYSYAGWFYNNQVHEFVYDGTYWVWMTRDNNSTTGTSYNAGSCPDNTTYATNGSVARVYSSLFQSVSSGKQQIASAITAKGVQTSSDATFGTMATNISNIPSPQTLITVGSSDTRNAKTFDLKNYSNYYSTLELGTTIFVHITGSAVVELRADGNGSPSYNSSTGILTVPRMTYYSDASGKTLYVKYTVFILN